jgi:tetratricopeptide (TPR) repeat protein
LEQARRLNADAEPFLLGGPNERALWRQRAKIADLANSSAEAAEFRARAEMTPATSALDRYPLIYEAWRESRLRDVIQMIREALDLDPTDIALWQVLGDAHLNLDEIDLAAGALDACRVLYPDLYRTHYQRGILELRRHRPAIARNEFDLALKSQSDFFPALMQRAIASAELGDITGAMSDLNAADRASTKLLSRAPAQIEFMRARLLTGDGDIAGAARAKAKGLARAPVDAADWVVRGLARIDDDPKAALGDFAEALKIEPRNRAALRNQANVLAESLDRPTDAIAVLDRLLELGESGQDLAGRGVVLARLGRRAEAHRDAVAALKADHRPFTRYQVAGIYALTARTTPSDALEAVRLLASAFRDGVGLNLVDSDSDLNPIRQRPEFQRVLDAARTLSEKSDLPQKPR